MSVKDNIAAMERQLALTKAYMSVSVSFGKGNRFPEDVKKEVLESVTAFCEASAEMNGDLCKTEKNQFTEEEVGLIRKILESLENKTKNQEVKSRPPYNQSNTFTQELESKSNNSPAKKAILLSLETLDPKMRQRVAPNSTVLVLKVDDKNEKALVSVPDKERLNDYYKLTIPLDLLEEIQ